MTSLGGSHLFLSASFPSGDRGREVEPYDADAIADAVTAIVRAVLLSDGMVLFGGHPTITSITPLVLLIGIELRVQRAVDIFQSRWFEDDVTPETLRLVESGVGQIHWTPKLDTRDASLKVMRDEMLAFRRPAAAVFVGGMSGISDEYAIFGREFVPEDEGRRAFENTIAHLMESPDQIGGARELRQIEFEALRFRAEDRARYPLHGARLTRSGRAEDGEGERSLAFVGTQVFGQ